MAQPESSRAILAAGVLAASAASACCLGPLFLVSVGAGGAWISNLTLLEPFRPLFIAIALLCMGLAYRNIYTKPTTQDCIPGSLCAIPETNRIYRVLFWIVSLLVAMALIYPYLLPLFV